MLVLLLLIALGGTDGWTNRGTQDGISIETRTLPNSKYESVRVSKQTRVPPEVQYDAIWGTAGIEGIAVRKAVSVHEVLLDEKQQRMYYQVVSAPLISDRDYVMRLERKKDGELYEMKFFTVDDARKPVTSEKIRIQVHGLVTIEPDGSGGSIMTYEVHCDLAGALPAWIARGPQRDSSVEWMKEMIGRGEKRFAPSGR